MSPRITPSQIFALILIWGGVAYGLAVKDQPALNAPQIAQLTACR